MNYLLRVSTDMNYLPRIHTVMNYLARIPTGMIRLLKVPTIKAKTYKTGVPGRSSVRIRASATLRHYGVPVRTGGMEPTAL